MAIIRQGGYTENDSSDKLREKRKQIIEEERISLRICPPFLASSKLPATQRTIGLSRLNPSTCFDASLLLSMKKESGTGL